MEQKFKMQIQRLAKQAVLTAVTVGILSAAAVFSQNSNPVYGAENGIYLAGANPSYRNPSTGAIEDSGGEGSAVLGTVHDRERDLRQGTYRGRPGGKHLCHNPYAVNGQYRKSAVSGRWKSGIRNVNAGGLFKQYRGLQIPRQQ